MGNKRKSNVEHMKSLGFDSYLYLNYFRTVSEKVANKRKPQDEKLRKQRAAFDKKASDLFDLLLQEAPGTSQLSCNDNNDVYNKSNLSVDVPRNNLNGSKVYSEETGSEIIEDAGDILGSGIVKTYELSKRKRNYKGARCDDQLSVIVDNTELTKENQNAKGTQYDTLLSDELDTYELQKRRQNYKGAQYGYPVVQICDKIDSSLSAFNANASSKPSNTMRAENVQDGIQLYIPNTTDDINMGPINEAQNNIEQNYTVADTELTNFTVVETDKLENLSNDSILHYQNNNAFGNLINIGNSCYMNSVLYTLSFTPMFLHGLHHLCEQLKQDINLLLLLLIIDRDFKSKDTCWGSRLINCNGKISLKSLSNNL